jgi:transcriptional regulator with XRE-family HTH domain
MLDRMQPAPSPPGPAAQEREPMKALPVEPSNAPVAIGSRIRAARQSQRMTIEQVADATGLTKGFLSRVERDLTSPSVASLVTLCQVLSLSIGDLFAQPETHLTRAAEAPRISLGGEGIVERLLTARSERRVQVLQADIEPRGAGESELYAVDCDVDVLHVVRGRIDLIMANERYSLAAGDTLTFPGREPHTWVNPSDEPARLLWVLVPAASR